MSEIKIIVLDTSELAEYEAVSKGYRKDVFVNLHEVYYKLNVYDIMRLKQDFESEVEEYGYFSIEPNLILTSEVSLEAVTQTIFKLHENGFFQYLKPINKETFEEIKQNN